MKVTMKDIAELAGVSRTTVDKVIHNRPGVSAEVKERVRHVILETNYRALHTKKIANDRSHELRIAVVMPDIRDSFMRMIKKGMDMAYLEYKTCGVAVDYYFYPDYEPQHVIAILEHLKTVPVDGIALRGVNNRKIVEYVDAYVEKKIPVITFDSDLSGSKRSVFVGEDLYRTGQISASLLCKSMGYSGEIGILTGSKNVNSCVKRVKGFTDYVRKNTPEVQIVAAEENLNQSVMTYTKTEEILKSHPDIRGLWNCVNCSESMAQAVIDMGKSRKVHMVTTMFTPRIVELVRMGIIDYTIGLTPYTIGQSTIKTLYDTIVSGIAPASDQIQTPMYIACDANVELFRDVV